MEHFLACAADRAVPVIGQVGKGSPGRDLALAVALVGAVDIAAVADLALPHGGGVVVNGLFFRGSFGKEFKMLKKQTSPSAAIQEDSAHE